MIVITTTAWASNCAEKQNKQKSQERESNTCRCYEGVFGRSQKVTEGSGEVTMGRGSMQTYYDS